MSGHLVAAMYAAVAPPRFSAGVLPPPMSDPGWADVLARWRADAVRRFAELPGAPDLNEFGAELLTLGLVCGAAAAVEHARRTAGEGPL